MIHAKPERKTWWLLRSDRGSVAIQIGIMMIAILGMVALGIEVSYLLLKHREMQSAADGAAMSGATALGTGSPADFRLEARAVAAAGGFTTGVDEAVVTVNSPPLSGPYTGNASAVEVIISQPQHLSLVRLFRSGLFNVGARAVALARPGYRYCILALDPTASGAVTVWNNAIVTNSQCGVAVNSNSASALDVRNNAAINGPTHVTGNALLTVNANLNGSPNEHDVEPIDDPYASVVIQTPPACTGQSGTVGNFATANFTAGHFCNGLVFGQGAIANFAAGAYYIDSKFTMGNNVKINATAGVTLIINGNYSVTFANGAIVNLTAPTTGPYAGMAIMGLRNATPTVVQTFRNGTTIDIQGVVYFPNQIINFENNGTTGISQCTQVIGRIVNISNNVQLNNNCDATGVQPLGAELGALSE